MLYFCDSAVSYTWVDEKSPVTWAVSSSHPETRSDDDPDSQCLAQSLGHIRCLRMREAVSKTDLDAGFQVPVVYPYASFLPSVTTLTPIS